MGQTTNYNLPYPELTDIPDVPKDIKSLAEQTDKVVKEQIDTLEKSITEKTKNKVDKKPGFDLSQENFTAEYKQQLDNLTVNLSNKGNAELKVKKNFSIPSESWVDDSTFIDYPYKATVTVEGITEKDWWCEVLTPDHTKPVIIQALSPYVFVGEGSFSLFSNVKFNETVIIENVVFERGLGNVE